MMKKHVLLVFLSLFYFTSCIVVPKNAVKNFKGCFNPKKTGLDSLINTKGFYYLGKDWKNISIGEFLFYDDGFVETTHGSYWLKQDFEDYKYGSYGTYTISNDTIRAHMISNPVRMGVYWFPTCFKIIDSHSIELVYCGNPKDTVKIEKFNSKLESNGLGTVYKFHPLKSKPDINKSYIMNKKWFWCNEEDFKEWKRKN